MGITVARNARVMATVISRVAKREIVERTREVQGAWSTKKKMKKKMWAMCPKDCITFFDGCNTCKCIKGKILGCTRKRCLSKKLKPKCKRYKKKGNDKGKLFV